MNDQQKLLSPRFIIAVLFFIVLAPFLPLLISGRWNWWEAWVYGAIAILNYAISRALASRRSPDLLAERARMTQQEDAEGWDKLLVPLIGLGGVLIPLTVGLDALFEWSPAFSTPAKVAALALILAGYLLGSSALIENRFFSGMVRIQTDRGHEVVTGGPYRWVRHPGYLGALATYLATPVFLDATWAFVPAFLFAVVLVIRTALEDRTLQDKLAGYRDYARQTRYRLIPGIW